MKKKIWTVVGCFAMVLVVAATSVGITLAALQGQVSSTFNISYTAKNVKAAVVGWVETDVGFAYKDEENYPKYVCRGNIHHIQPLIVDGQDYTEFTGDESGTLNKQFDPINLDFQIDSKVVNDMKKVILHDGTVAEDKFQMSQLEIDDLIVFRIYLIVVNLDGDAELPVQYNIQNFDKSGDIGNIELLYGPELDELFEEEWPDYFPLDNPIPNSSKTMTFSQYTAELRQQLSSEWNGEFPYLEQENIIGSSGHAFDAYFLDANASNECMAVLGTAIITWPLPQEMYEYHLSMSVNNHINSASFSGNINLTLGAF